MAPLGLYAILFVALAMCIQEIYILLRHDLLGAIPYYARLSSNTIAVVLRKPSCHARSRPVLEGITLRYLSAVSTHIPLVGSAVL